MIVKIDYSFEKDVSALRDVKLLKQIAVMIEDVQAVHSIQEVKSIKRLKGYKTHYRIRLGDYRAGLIVNDNIVEFIRFLHRKEIYKRFLKK